MAKTKPTDPLSKEEMEAAAEQFFPLFNVIHSRMPDFSKVEDTLKVMENVAKLAHKKRADDKKKAGPFGFNKEDDKDD
tara:strand:- start:176 stop:409 length:234 start_codon:yes stop_codon:yes gene_type:complete